MRAKKKISRATQVRIVISLIIFAIGVSWYYFTRSDVRRTLRILCYSSFNQAWGPGPELISKFKDLSPIDLQVVEAEDAGLLLQKLKVAPADLVIGLDQLMLPEARATMKWVRPSLSTNSDEEFISYDWAPLAFVHRKEKLQPPTSLDDLLSPRFARAIALQDPRTSSPGLQFLLWVLDEKGIDEGFRYLEKLKPNIHTVSPSWSSAYGLFTKDIAKMVMSYVTSPLYHLIVEKDSSVTAAVFEAGHPIQIEYAAIPAGAENRDLAEEFLRYMRTPEAQAIIMRKNFMMPIVDQVMMGTEWENLRQVKSRPWKNLPHLLNQKSEIFERWRKLQI